MAAASKVCRECGERKELADYYAEAKSADGRRAICRDCFLERRRRRATMSANQVAAELASRATKVCAGCDTLKPRSAFRQKRSGSRDGLAPRCKTCESAWQKAHYAQVRDVRKEQAAEWYAANRSRRIEVRKTWYRANAERVADAQRTRRAADPETFTEYQRVRRARVRAALVGPVDLDALWTGSCGICGDPLDRDLSHPDPLSKSLDHIVPISRGGEHAQHNLQWTHLVCNLSKGDRMPGDRKVAS